MKRKQKDLSLDEIIRQFIRCAERIERSSNGCMQVTIQFGPKAKKQGKRASARAGDNP